MQVKKINDWFEKFGRFEVRHRWAFIICLLVITVAGCLGLTRLKLDNGEEDWFDDWETTKQNQDHFEAIFGSTDTLMAHITAKDVFDPEVLEMIDSLGDELLEKVPYASGITSLMELSIPIGTEEGFEITSPLCKRDDYTLGENMAFLRLWFLQKNPDATVVPEFVRDENGQFFLNFIEKELWKPSSLEKEISTRILA